MKLFKALEVLTIRMWFQYGYICKEFILNLQYPLRLYMARPSDWTFWCFSGTLFFGILNTKSKLHFLESVRNSQYTSKYELGWLVDILGAIV